MREKKLLQQIVANTTPRASVQSVETDPSSPQSEWSLANIDCAVAFAGTYLTNGRVLRPPSGVFYHIVAVNYSIVTGAGSANQYVGLSNQTDTEATERGQFALGQYNRWWWISPVIAASHQVSVLAAEGIGYTFYEAQAGYDFYYVPLPSNLLISNTHPLRIHGVNVAGDAVWAHVVYEEVRT